MINELQSEVKRILLQPGDVEGCGYYRVLSPLTYLCEREGYEALFSQKLLDMKQLGEVNPNMIVTQRQFDKYKLKYYKEIKSTYPNIKLIMDVDDLLWGAHPGSPFKFSFEDKTNLKYIIKLCDQLTVSTVPLQEQFVRLADCPVSVAPNLIQQKFYREPKPRKNSKLRIVYAGGVTHGPDLQQILSVVEMTHTKFEWIFLGYIPDRLKKYVRFYQGVHILQYMSRLTDIDADLAVAPLLQNKFNECKSNVKLLEYGAIGIPAITSNVYPYHDNPGVKISSTRSRDWMRAINEFENEDYRFEIAKLTYDYARKFCLQDNYGLLYNIYFKELQ